jgi:hypothetical protein
VSNFGKMGLRDFTNIGDNQFVDQGTLLLLLHEKQDECLVPMN